MQKQLKCLLNLSWICFSFSYRKLKKKSFMDSHNLRVSFPKLIKKAKPYLAMCLSYLRPLAGTINMDFGRVGIAGCGVCVCVHIQ